MTRAEYVHRTRAYRAALERLEHELGKDLPPAAQAILRRECDHVRAELDASNVRVGVRPPFRVIRS